MKKRQTKSPIRYLFSEIDVELQILDTIEMINMELFKLQHVHGHQDTKEDCTIQQLPWESQLNIYCNQLATREISNMKK